MKKKILVTGTNMALVKDFIQHSDRYFKAMGATDCWHDIQLHFELFDPEAYIIFPDASDDVSVTMVNKLKSHISYNKCPIFLCAPVDVCAKIQRTNPKFVDLFLKRPVSADNLSLRIIKYFEDEEKKRIAEEKAKTVDYTPDENSSGNAKYKDAANTEVNVQSKKHILVVDDDRTILKMLKTALEEKYEVTTMVNGVLVEKFLKSKKVDLIVLDYEMPIKTGADVLRDIKSYDKSHEIPICFLTGVAERDKIMDILSLKPDAYLLKPVNMEAFLATVSNLVD